MRSPRLIVSLFMRRDVHELRALVDGNFDTVKSGAGMMVSSSVNGSAFSFYAPTMLSPLEVAQFALMALDHKEAGWCGPTDRTTARFF
jgi:hypothetical protein